MHSLAEAVVVADVVEAAEVVAAHAEGAEVVAAHAEGAEVVGTPAGRDRRQVRRRIAVPP
jgi:hypothetical protein